MTMQPRPPRLLHGIQFEDRLSRRAVILRGAALGLGAPLIVGLLAACGGDDAEPTQRPAAATSTVMPLDAAAQTTQEGIPAMASSSEHYALAGDDSEAIWFLGTLAFIRAAGERTGEGIGMVEFIHPAGFATPFHVHHDEDEAFYVIEGAMRGICGDQPWQATTGAFVWLPRDIPHGYTVDGEETLRTLAISLPAGFERFVREAGEPAAERVLPPPGAPNLEKLNAAVTKYGQETLGPLDLNSLGPPAASPTATP